jgi:aryl-alcohol dehydrogenase-like predicted oxidoreductase
MSEATIWPFGQLVLGCGNFGGVGGAAHLVGRGLDESASTAAMDEAVDLGITLFDTAERYALGASETMIGRWLAEREANVTARIRIATKVAPAFADGSDDRFDAALIERKLSGSLDRLGVDAVELLLSHAPDDDTPIEDTLEGFEAMRASGRCRLVGGCNLDADQLTAALDAADRLGLDGYQVVQNGYSLLQPSDDARVRVMCRERGLAYTAFSPLAGGALTGKYERDVAPPPDSRLALRPEGVDEILSPALYDAIDRLRDRAAEKYVAACGALALAWLLRREDVSAFIAGPSRRAPHLELAAQAATLAVTDEDVADIESWFTPEQQV